MLYHPSGRRRRLQGSNVAGRGTLGVQESESQIAALEVCPTVRTDPPRAHISNCMLDVLFNGFLNHINHNH